MSENMAAHITTAEAKQLKLPGSDSFRHLMYYDAPNRDFAAVRLNAEALKAFSDTVAVGRRHEMTEHMTANRCWIDRGGFASGAPAPESEAMWRYLDHINYENLKIACGFELHLKARLIAEGYVVHNLNRKDPKYKVLASQQEDRPIRVVELLAIKPFSFDGKQNYLPGLKSTSLNFEQMSQESGYQTVLNLSVESLGVIEYYRCLRNQIHLPGEPIEIPDVRFAGTVVDFLVNFINNEIITMSNRLMDQHSLGFSRLGPLC